MKASEMKEALPVNTTISHCRLLSHLGAGGMGFYVAEDKQLDCKVAIKFLPAGGPLRNPLAASRQIKTKPAYQRY